MALSRYVRASHTIGFFGLVVFIGLATTPRASTAATLTVCASGCTYSDLQAALNAAQPGDTILLRAGETYTGHFELPVKSNSSGAYITIRSDAPASALPAAGTRLVPHGRPGGNTSLSALARLRGLGGHWKTTPVIEAAPGAHHYRLQFLDVDGIGQEGWETLVTLGTSKSVQNTLASVPYAIALDRVYIHGHAIKGQKRCLALNGADLEIRDSYVANCASFSTDAQAIAAFNGPGPYRIINNYLEGSGENVMFGGADPKIDGLVPSDIEIRRNHFTKPLAWRQPILAPPSTPAATAGGGGSLAAGTHYFKVIALMETQWEWAHSVPSGERAVTSSSGGAVTLSWGEVTGAERYRIYRGTQSGGQNRYIETTSAATSFTYTGSGESSGTPPSAGTRFFVKNLLELKNAQRVTVDGNLFEQNWSAGQSGYAILLTPRNEEGTAPWSVVRDVMFSNNILRHAAAGINILGRDDLQTSERTERVTIRNNLVYDMSSSWGGSSNFIIITRSPSEVKVDHNTIFHEGMVVLVDDGESPGFVFTNNLLPHNTYGIFGSGAGTGIGALTAYFPDAVVRRNAFGGGPASLYPPDNFFPDMTTFLAQFVNASAADYRLVSSSSFRDAGTDGKDLGVDFVTFNAAQGGGGSSEPAPPPSGDSTPYGGTHVALPGLIQAENFDEGGAGAAYHDTTTGNAGGQYRSTNVDIETTGDAGGGYNVGWMAPGEWLNYSVNVTAAGTYDLEFRVASSGGGGTFRLEVNGADKTGTLTIPDTGGWQTWTTVRKSGVSLGAGQQTWRLVVLGAGSTGAVGNLNWMRVVTGTTPASSPYGGTPAAIPGTIQAENFDEGGPDVAYRDTTSGNSGGQYRSTDVDIETTRDTGGGHNVGWIAPGEWLRYTVNVGTDGTYDLEFRVASPGGGGTFHLEVNGSNVTGALSVPDTGGWQSWATVRKTGVSLSAGVQAWRFVMDSAGSTGNTGNVNYIGATAAGGSTTPPSSGDDIVLHPSDVTAISGNWARVSSTSGAGGQKMQSADRGWSATDAPRAAPADYFEATFTPEAGRAYRVWLRLRAGGNSKWNDSVWVQFSGAVTSSGGALWPIGSTSALLVNLENCNDCGVSGWGWQNRGWWASQDAVVRFASGTPQTIRVQTREDGADVDQIVLSPVTYYDRAPGALTDDATILSRSGAGGSEPPPSSASDVVLYPSDVTRISGNWARVSSTTGAGGQKMYSEDWGWSAANAPMASPTHYFEATFSVEANRAYRIWLRLRAKGESKWNDAVWVQFSGSVDSSGSPLWRIGSSSGLLVNLEDCNDCGLSQWGWQNRAWWLDDDPVVRFTTAGPHTVRVQIREDGVDVDQIVLSPVTYFDHAPGPSTKDSTIVPK
jgi:hypothetical protein